MKSLKVQIVASITLFAFSISSLLLSTSHVTFAAVHDYTVTGGNPASLPAVGAVSIALPTITIAGNTDDDFANNESITIYINTSNYDGVTFDETVAALTIGGTCTFSGATGITYEYGALPFYSHYVTFNLTDDAEANGCSADNQTITIAGLRITSAFSRPAPGAFPLVTVIHNTTGGDTLTSSSSTVNLTAVMPTNNASVLFSNLTVGTTTTTVTLTIPYNVNVNNGYVHMVFPAFVDISGVASSTSGSFYLNAGSACHVNGDQEIRCSGAPDVVVQTTPFTGTLTMTGLKTKYASTDDMTSIISRWGSGSDRDISLDTSVTLTDVTAADAAASVVLANPSVGGVGNTTVTFTLPVALANTNTVVMTFPAHMNVASAAFSSKTDFGGAGTFSGCAASGQIVTCTAGGAISGTGSIIMTGITASTTGIMDISSFQINNDGVMATDSSVSLTDVVSLTKTRAVGPTNYDLQQIQIQQQLQQDQAEYLRLHPPQQVQPPAPAPTPEPASEPSPQPEIMPEVSPRPAAAPELLVENIVSVETPLVAVPQPQIQKQSFQQLETVYHNFDSTNTSYSPAVSIARNLPVTKRPAIEYLHSLPDFKNWEKQKGVTVDSGSKDSNHDGVSDMIAYLAHTDPLSNDTDKDGIPDSREIFNYGTNPNNAKDPGSLEKLGVRFTGMRTRQTIASSSQFVTGVGPVSSEVTVIFTDLAGNPFLTGFAKTDVNGVFLFAPKQTLDDGSYLVKIRSDNSINPPGKASLDVAHAADFKEEYIESKPRMIHVNSKLNVTAPNLKKLADENISDDVLLNDLKIEIKDNKPVLAGKAGFNNEVIVNWSSIVMTSALIADNTVGDFSVQPPQTLPIGDHTVYVQSLRPGDKALSKMVKISFNISKAAGSDELLVTPIKTSNEQPASTSEPTLKPAPQEAAPVNILPFVCGGVLLLIVFGGLIIVFRRKKAILPLLSASEPTTIVQSMPLPQADVAPELSTQAPDVVSPIESTPPLPAPPENPLQ